MKQNTYWMYNRFCMNNFLSSFTPLLLLPYHSYRNRALNVPSSSLFLFLSLLPYFLLSSTISVVFLFLVFLRWFVLCLVFIVYHLPYYSCSPFLFSLGVFFSLSIPSLCNILPFLTFLPYSFYYHKGIFEKTKVESRLFSSSRVSYLFLLLWI